MKEKTQISLFCTKFQNLWETRWIMVVSVGNFDSLAI